MDVKQDSVLIAIRYVLLDFRQNGHEKWYVYLLHFVVNCISLMHAFQGRSMPVGNLSADMQIPHITKIYFRLNV